jgi:hypothetical protein
MQANLTCILYSGPAAKVHLCGHRVTFVQYSTFLLLTQTSRISTLLVMLCRVSFSVALFVVSALATPTSEPSCKVTPAHADWPSDAEWTQLNNTLSGALIATTPVASSCYNGNPFKSKVPCADVIKSWTDAKFHASLPESVDFPVWANRSCVPPGANGWSLFGTCSYGGLPRYVVNASSERHVETSLIWAAQKNIRVIIKGTGHDILGR